MPKPGDKKNKWKESIVLVAFLILLGLGVFGGISRWERFSHVYSYGDGMRIKPENIVQAKSSEQSKEKDKKENKSENDETPSPEPSQTPINDNQGEEIPESTPKQDEPHGNPTKNPESTSDVEVDGDNSDDEGNNTSEDNDGGTENNGEGGEKPVVEPDGESTGESPKPGETPKASPIPTPTPSPSPKATPTKSPVPEHTEEPDEVIGLQCSWPDKDSLIYGKEIPKNTIVVKAEYESGKVVTLNSGEYMITGLKNDSLGEHTMTIIYQGIYYEMDYTVKNAYKSISYDWPTKDKCYYEEDVKAEITVYVHMADGSVEAVYEGFSISGIDNKDTSGEQEFTISYGGFSVTGTCRFYDLEYTEVVKYYDGDTLVDEVTTKEENVDHESEIINKAETEVVTYGGAEYTLDEVKLVVDGKNKSLPYVIKERDFVIKIEKVFKK